jgi:hypothetical protein
MKPESGTFPFIPKWARSWGLEMEATETPGSRVSHFRLSCSPYSPSLLLALVRVSRYLRLFSLALDLRTLLCWQRWEMPLLRKEALTSKWGMKKMKWHFPGVMGVLRGKNAELVGEAPPSPPALHHSPVLSPSPTTRLLLGTSD